jgi:hypothetical protein
MTQELEKRVSHVGVRFYRSGGVELALVPLLKETASFARSAGEGYFLVCLTGEPGSAYPLNLRMRSSLEADYLAKKFKLDRRGFGYTPEELAATLDLIADDLEHEENLDR